MGPAWQPTFPLGDPGWRQSTDPLCETNQGSEVAFGVWADPRGVFALFGMEDCFAPLAFPPPPPCVVGKAGETIQFNDGTGWKLVHYEPSPPRWGQITGFPNGPAVLVGAGVDFLNLAGTKTNQITFNAGEHGVFVVDSELAYAYDASTVLQYAGGAWSAIATLPMQYPNNIWADSHAIVVAGPQQGMYLKHGAADFVRMSGVPAGDYYGLWGFSETDLYAGNQIGQLLHYDGASWNVVATSPSGSIVRSIWGIDGGVYFNTGYDLGLWDGQTSTTLLASPTDKPVIAGIWGLSKNEVFVWLYDASYSQYQCGGSFILWFDGTQFHRF